MCENGIIAEFPRKMALVNGLVDAACFWQHMSKDFPGQNCECRNLTSSPLDGVRVCMTADGCHANADWSSAIIFNYFLETCVARSISSQHWWSSIFPFPAFDALFHGNIRAPVLGPRGKRFSGKMHARPSPEGKDVIWWNANFNLSRDPAIYLFLFTRFHRDRFLLNLPVSVIMVTLGSGNKSHWRQLICLAEMNRTMAERVETQKHNRFSVFTRNNLRTKRGHLKRGGLYQERGHKLSKVFLPNFLMLPLNFFAFLNSFP